VLTLVWEDFTDPLSLSCLKKAPFTRLLKKDTDIMSILGLKIYITSQKLWSHPHHHKSDTKFAGLSESGQS